MGHTMPMLMRLLPPSEARAAHTLSAGRNRTPPYDSREKGTQRFWPGCLSPFSSHHLIFKCAEFPHWRIKTPKFFPRRPRSLISHKWPQGWKKSPKLRLVGERDPFCLIFFSFLGTSRLSLRQWKIPKCQAALK